MSLSSFVTEQKSEAHLVAVADGVHAWIGAGGDSNAGAIETPEGVIVIDTQGFQNDMTQKSTPIPPLFKADSATLAFSASKDGKIRVTYIG
jgi:hypothetical protein